MDSSLGDIVKCHFVVQQCQLLWLQCNSSCSRKINGC